MRIKVIGDCASARALRGLLRKAGFAVTEFLPAELVSALPSGGYVVYVEESADARNILFDSTDSELEANILRHVSQLSPNPVKWLPPAPKLLPRCRQISRREVAHHKILSTVSPF